MIMTLSGENSFALSQALHDLTWAFVAKYGDLALERLDDEASYEAIQQSLTSPPFLAAKKLVVLRGVSANKQFTEQAEQLFAALPATTDVILVEPKLDKRLGFYKLLKTKTDFQYYGQLDGVQLADWLMKRAKAADGSLSREDARYLIDRLGANQQVLSSELDKLLLYSPRISRQTISLLTEPAPQSTVFELLEAAFSGNLQRAMELYAEQRALKVEPPQIIAMLAWQLHVLALLKTAQDRSTDEIAKSAKLNPFVVRKSQAIARKLSLSQLKQLISDLLQIDFRSKRTGLDADEALQNYLLKLAISS